MLGRLAKPAELKEALEVIRGAALERPRRKPTENYEQEVPLSALGQVVEEISKCEPITASPAALLFKCSAYARNLKLLNNDPNFPTSEDQLGKQLVALIPIMAKRGVKLERHNHDRPRNWTIHPKQDHPVPIEEVGAQPDGVRQTSETEQDHPVLPDEGPKKSKVRHGRARSVGRDEFVSDVGPVVEKVFGETDTSTHSDTGAGKNLGRAGEGATEGGSQ
jgi:hypothetical protein